MKWKIRYAISSIFFVSALYVAGTAACADIAGMLAPTDSSVIAVIITPSSATLNVGEKLTLIATVVAGAAQTNRTVRWASQNAAVATVNATTGEVSAIGGGTTGVIAISVADSSVKGVASITVGSILLGPAISTISQDGKPAVLSNISGKIDVVVNLPAGPPGYSAAGLLLNCGGTDTVVATQSLTGTVSVEQSITLSFNTAAFKNGPCLLKAQATTSSGAIVRSSATPITLNNPTASAASLRPEHLRDARLQRVQLLSQSLITLHRVAPDPLIHASGHAGEIGDLRL